MSFLWGVAEIVTVSSRPFLNRLKSCIVFSMLTCGILLNGLCWSNFFGKLLPLGIDRWNSVKSGRNSGTRYEHNGNTPVKTWFQGAISGQKFPRVSFGLHQNVATESQMCMNVILRRKICLIWAKIINYCTRSGVLATLFHQFELLC